MPTLTDRALFLTNAYRYAESSNASLKIESSDARVVTLDTQLTLAVATQLAGFYQTEFGKIARSFEVKIDGVLSLDDFLTGPPVFTLTAPTYGVNGLQGRAIGYTIDHGAQETTIVLRVAV